MTPDQIRSLAADGEGMRREFKRDVNDNKLVETVVCLANGDGGTLVLGVEDDGTIVGARPRHGRRTDPARVAAIVANCTSPSVAVAVAVVDVDGLDVVAIEVPKGTGLVSTTGGLYLRRAMTVHGKPECVAMQPHEAMARVADLGARDLSTNPLADALIGDLDGTELQRFRSLAAAGGDQVLSDLSDEDLLRALGFHAVDGRLTLGAVLLFGRPATIRRFAPTHETAFQVIDDLEVRVNKISHRPLIASMLDLVAAVQPYNAEEEIQDGLFRLGLPAYAEVALRELVANALVHRSYAANGQVRVVIEDGTLSVSSQGGFPEGISTANLLTAPPRPRNPLIAEAFKRAGLVERTGRGINRAFRSQLAAGRPAPDYSRSTSSWVEARLRAGPADRELAAFVAHAERRGEPISLPTLQVLHEIRLERRLTTAEAADLLQVPVTQARSELNALVERGYLEARGSGKGRTYHLAAALYRSLGGGAAYVRTRGFDAIQQKQMILTFVREHGGIVRNQVADLCQLTPQQAAERLKQMRAKGLLVMTGGRRTARYHLPDHPPGDSSP